MFDLSDTCLVYIEISLQVDAEEGATLPSWSHRLFSSVSLILCQTLRGSLCDLGFLSPFCRRWKPLDECCSAGNRKCSCISGFAQVNPIGVPGN